MDQTSALAARLATNLRSASSRMLTCDNTLRVITLTAGGWHLYGSSTQAWVATRFASDADGALQGDEEAPDLAIFAAASAGTPDAGEAWDDSEDLTAIPLPADDAEYIEIAVATGGFLNLYVSGGTTTLQLVGPFK